jgi:DNA-binding transcriptional LysR family regulator
MPRHLDLTALRSFVVAAELGGVTKAAAQLNLTQSAVSMQIKRLEEGLGQALLDRAGRGAALTPQGEQLLTYARRLLALNDEAWGRMTDQAFEGQINFGAPHDVIYPSVPRLLQRFARAYPRVKVHLHSLFTTRLKEMMSRGEMDVILTTEAELGPGGETLAAAALVWVGAEDGQAWRGRPLRFASTTGCIFKRHAIGALDRAGLPWELAVDSTSCSAVHAMVAADFAVHVQLRGAIPAQCEEVRHGGALPDLPEHLINMYMTTGPRAGLASRLAEAVRVAYGVAPGRVAAE